MSRAEALMRTPDSLHRAGQALNAVGDLPLNVQQGLLDFFAVAVLGGAAYGLYRMWKNDRDRRNRNNRSGRSGNTTPLPPRG